MGLLIGGGLAAKQLGVGRHLLYRDADNLDLTVLRRNRLHGGRYFLVNEIDNLINSRRKAAHRFNSKRAKKLARRSY